MTIVLSLPPPTLAKASAITLTFPSPAALQLVLASRRDAIASSATPPSSSSPELATFFSSKFKDLTNIDVSFFQLVKASIGDVVLRDQRTAGGADATVRFFKGAIGEEGARGGEMGEVLKVLRDAAIDRR